jgi:hypothetical protein
MRRTDSMPLIYVKKRADKIAYRPHTVTRQERQWSREARSRWIRSCSHVSQMVIGAFRCRFGAFPANELSAEAHPVAYATLLIGLLALETSALVISTQHLGKPHRFYRAFYNLRYSAVSREVASVAVFYNAMVLYTLLVAVPGLFSWLLPQGLMRGLQTFSGWLAGGRASGFVR